MNHPRSSDVLWITNISSPYRRPVWQALGKTRRLVVGVLEDDQRLIREGRRGPDWVADSSETYRVRNLRALRLTRGEATYYFLLSWLSSRDFGSVLIGGWESPAYWQALLLARLSGLRVVGFYESTMSTNRFSRGPISWARSWFFRHLDAIVVPGAAAKSALLSMGVREERVFTGFNAVDVRRFNSESRRNRESLEQSRRGHRFVYVGQLIPRKNVEGMLRAFSMIRDGEDALTIVGTGEREGPLRQLADELGVASHVEFVGHRANQELPIVLASQDTLVLPSFQEVWGLVVNEALACGLHVVVSESAGVTTSVAGMEGVFATGIATQQIAEAMAASRAQWTGPIENPAILVHTPQEFARVFTRALESP